jgi:hypothetical protein
MFALLLAPLLLLSTASISGAMGIDETYIRPRGKSQWTEILEIFTRPFGPKSFGKSYALVVGIGNYDHYDDLSAPNKDAVRVRNFLRDEAGFDHIVTLTDDRATRGRIEGLMEREFPKLIRENDRFLFYFSGHGETRDLRREKRGYLVLKPASSGEWDVMIDMPRVQQWIENLGNARHTLFLLDACFSGLAGIEGKGGDNRDQTINRLIQPGHHLLTAGVEGEKAYIVNEASLFTSAFLAAVHGAGDYTGDGIISLSEIFNYINQYLDAKRAQLRGNIEMSPHRYDSRFDDNAGEFFFLSKVRSEQQAADVLGTSLENMKVENKGSANNQRLQPTQTAKSIILSTPPSAPIAEPASQSPQEPTNTCMDLERKMRNLEQELADLSVVSDALGGDSEVGVSNKTIKPAIKPATKQGNAPTESTNCNKEKVSRITSESQAMENHISVLQQQVEELARQSNRLQQFR